MLAEYIHVNHNIHTFANTLGEMEGKLARLLLGGHPPFIAKVIMAMDNTQEAVFTLFLDVRSQQAILVISEKYL